MMLMEDYIEFDFTAFTSSESSETLYDSPQGRTRYSCEESLPDFALQILYLLMVTFKCI